jgi:hypothetical protein
VKARIMAIVTLVAALALTATVAVGVTSSPPQQSDASCFVVWWGMWPQVICPGSGPGGGGGGSW